MTVYLLKYETEIGGIFSSKEEVRKHFSRPDAGYTPERIEAIINDADPYVALIPFELNVPQMIDC